MAPTLTIWGEGQVNSFLWKLVPKSSIIFKILINVTKYLLMICSCHNWQNKRKATDVRWRRKICDQVTALHTGIIDHLFLIFSFQICIAPPVLSKNWYIFCQITEIHTVSLHVQNGYTITIPITQISRIFDQSERCWLVFFPIWLYYNYDFEYPFWLWNFGIWNWRNCVMKISEVTFHCWSKEWSILIWDSHYDLKVI